MPIDFDITASVRQNSAIPFGRLIVVRRFKELPLAQIRRGIIYFFAGWGVLSLAYFRRVTKSLMPWTETPWPEIYVVDIDCVPEDFLMSTFGHSYPAGSGETAWVRDGRIVSVVDIYLGEEVEAEVTRCTRELLDDNSI